MSRQFNIGETGTVPQEAGIMFWKSLNLDLVKKEKKDSTTAKTTSI